VSQQRLSEYVEHCSGIDSAFCDPNPEIRKLALENSTDQNAFRYVALNDRDPEIRQLALQRLE